MAYIIYTLITIIQFLLNLIGLLNNQTGSIGPVVNCLSSVYLVVQDVSVQTLHPKELKRKKRTLWRLILANDNCPYPQTQLTMQLLPLQYETLVDQIS